MKFLAITADVAESLVRRWREKAQKPRANAFEDGVSGALSVAADELHGLVLLAIEAEAL